MFPLSNRFMPRVLHRGYFQKDYQKNINNLVLFLSGEKKRLLKNLTKDDPKKAESLKHIQDASLLDKRRICWGRKGKS